MSHIWVVEIQVFGKWIPTVGVGITEDECKKEKHVFGFNNLDDKFRVRKYVRVSNE